MLHRALNLVLQQQDPRVSPYQASRAGTRVGPRGRVSVDSKAQGVVAAVSTEGVSSCRVGALCLGWCHTLLGYTFSPILCGLLRIFRLFSDAAH